MSELLTVAEVASVLKCSEDAVVKRFAKMQGVIDLGREESRHHRRYRVLRIPRVTLEKYLATKAGHPVSVEIPPRPERRRRSPKWQDAAALNLAKAALQNGCHERTVFNLIARQARIMTLVPQNLWNEVLEGWWEDDEHDDIVDGLGMEFK